MEERPGGSRSNGTQARKDVNRRETGRAFPNTPPSAVFGVRSTDAAQRSRSLNVLAARYWKATYKYIRLRWNKEPAAAEEITQEFFLRAVDKNTFVGYDPRQARFRTFLRVCVDRFVVDVERHQHAKKRGGGVLIAQRDFKTAEEELEVDDADTVDPEALFEAAWVRSLLDASVESFRAASKRKGKTEHFQVFELFHLRDEGERLTYEEIAAELGISVGDVNNRLAYARREFRAAVLEALRECTGSEQEMQDEARVVLGVRF